MVLTCARVHAAVGHSVKSEAGGKVKQAVCFSEDLMSMVCLACYYCATLPSSGQTLKITVCVNIVYLLGHIMTQNIYTYNTTLYIYI